MARLLRGLTAAMSAALCLFVLALVGQASVVDAARLDRLLHRSSSRRRPPSSSLVALGGPEDVADDVEPAPRPPPDPAKLQQLARRLDEQSKRFRTALDAFVKEKEKAAEAEARAKQARDAAQAKADASQAADVPAAASDENPFDVDRMEDMFKAGAKADDLWMGFTYKNKRR